MQDPTKAYDSKFTDYERFLMAQCVENKINAMKEIQESSEPWKQVIAKLANEHYGDQVALGQSILETGPDDLNHKQRVWLINVLWGRLDAVSLRLNPNRTQGEAFQESVLISIVEKFSR